MSVTLKNKTKQYLIHVLKDYGEIFLNQIAKPYKLGVGINDNLLPKNLNFNNHIFILLDITKQSIGERDINQFTEFLEWIKKQHYFVYDYVYDDLILGHKHMVVIDIPEKYHDTYKAFIDGRYSDMFPKESRLELFDPLDPVFKVITKHDDAHKRFANMLKNDFDVEFDDWSEELEYPIVMEEEVFNYKS